MDKIADTGQDYWTVTIYHQVTDYICFWREELAKYMFFIRDKFSDTVKCCLVLQVDANMLAVELSRGDSAGLLILGAQRHKKRNPVASWAYLLHDALIIFSSSETYLNHLQVLLLPIVVSARLALANAMVGVKMCVWPDLFFWCLQNLHQKHDFDICCL